MTKVKILRQKTNLVDYAMEVLAPESKRGTGDINRSINKRIEYAVTYAIDLTKRWQALKKPPAQKAMLSPIKMYRFFFDPENIGLIATFFMARIFPVMRKYKHLKTPMRLFIITYLHTHKLATREEMAKALSKMKINLIGVKMGYELVHLVSGGMVIKSINNVDGKDKSMFKLSAEGQQAAGEFLNKTIVYDCMKYAGIKRKIVRTRSQSDKKRRKRYWKNIP